MLARHPALAQTPIDAGYRVDKAYGRFDSFGTLRKDWLDADVRLFVETRNGIEHRVHRLETTWDAVALDGNSIGCEQGLSIVQRGDMGAVLAAWEVDVNYANKHLGTFHADWKARNVQMYFYDAGSPPSSKQYLDPQIDGLLSRRQVHRNADDSLVGKVIYDGGSVGVILEPEFPAPGPGFLPALDATGIAVMAGIGLALGVLGFFLGRHWRAR